MTALGARRTGWRSTQAWQRWLIWVAAALAYALVAYLILKPVLQTPVSDDDFEGPIANFTSSHYSLLNAISLGWHETFVSGDRSRVVGVVLGNVYDWLWLWLSQTLSVSVAHIYEATKYVVFIFCALSTATFWCQVSKLYGRPMRWPVAATVVSILLFGTLQLHPWSADPVQSYPLAGFLSTAFGFWVMITAVWALQRPTGRRFLMATIAGILASSWYEFNLGAVIGAGILFLAAAWAARSELRRAIRIVLGGAICVFVPVVIVAITHFTSQGDTYTGRQLSSHGAAHSFLVGVIGALPGASWPLSAANVGLWHMLTVLAGVVAVLGVVIILLIRPLAIRSPAGSEAATPGTLGTDLLPPKLGVVATVLAVVMFAAFALALEGATTRIEGLQIGYVYTAYTVEATVVALLGAQLVVWLLRGRDPRRRACAATALVIVGCFLALQYGVNSRLNQVSNGQFWMNTGFDNALSKHVPEQERCDNLVNWVSYPWPAYYRAGVIDGSYHVFEQFNHEPMCSDWTAPTENFSAEGTPGPPAYWMTGNAGEIEFEIAGCENGCSGHLQFSASGFFAPHTLTIANSAGTVLKRVRVPKTGSIDVSVPLKLPAEPIGEIDVNASGVGVTPKSKHIDADTRALFISMVNPRFVPTR